MTFDCDAIAIEGHFRIPDDLLVGIYISYGLNADFTDPAGFDIGSVIYFRDGITISFRYNGEKVAETTIDLTGTNTQRVYSILGYNNQFIYGSVVIGNKTGLLEQPVGEWEFNVGAAPIDPFCVRPSVEEVSALYVQSNSRMLGPFYGDIKLVEGENIRLNVRSAHDVLQCLEEPLSGEGTEVVINSYRDSTTDIQTCVSNINGVEPDSNGGIAITGRSCMDITTNTSQSSITLDDKCAEPCCTCTELEPIEVKILEITTSIKELQEHIGTLQLQADFLIQTLTSVK